NYRVYGVRKVWRQLQRKGFDVARCTVARLMQAMGLEGVIRGKPIRTTVSDKAAPCPLDHVNRQFQAPAPNMLWLSDFTYVSTRAGFVYVARPCMSGGLFIGVAWCITQTAARNTSAFDTPSGWRRPGSSPRWAASATAMTTLS